MKNCPSCGTGLPHNAHFCGHCGYTLDATKILTKATHKRQPLAKDINRSAIPIADAHIAIVHSKEPANLPVPAQTAITERLPRVRDPKSEMPRVSSQKTTRSQAITWGWLPVLSLTSAIGVFLVALAYEAGRLSMPWSDPLFWFGLLVLFLPVAWCLFSKVPVRRERIALLILLGIGLYLVKFLQYPLYFANNDEFLHWRTVYDIVASGHLFQANPILLISTFYPGLEIVTSALISLTGLSPFPMGILVIGVVARLLFTLTLYLFYERASDSMRGAGIATLLYMMNSDFLLGNAIFSYESIALPLAVFVVLALALRSSKPAGLYRGLTLAIWLGIGAVVITHHITSYALVAFLFLWAVVSFLHRRYQKDWAGRARAAFLSLVLCIAWLKYTGDIVVNYLSPRLDDTVSQLSQILTSQRAPRQLFHDGAGLVNPLWERIVSSASVVVIVLVLPIGIFYIWRNHRVNATALALVGGALLYPVSQALRLVAAAGTEMADRSSAFLFLGVAFVLAIGINEFWLAQHTNWRRPVIVMGALAVIVVGQVIAGNGPPWIRIPGPYLVIADSRSIEPEGITAAEWADVYLGSEHRIATDHVNTMLMATYGNEQVLTQWSAKTSVEPIFTSLQFDPETEAILRQDRVEYLVVDRRLSTSLPRMGSYFENPASGELQNKLINPAALAKFDGLKNVSRLFDSGDIVIYDVRAITNTPSPTVTSPSKGTG